MIATPNALHAEQCIRSLDAGKAVFCQKPLGRTAEDRARWLYTAITRAERGLVILD